jgi:hypothetical protein
LQGLARISDELSQLRRNTPLTKSCHRKQRCLQPFVNARSKLWLTLRWTFGAKRVCTNMEDLWRRTISRQPRVNVRVQSQRLQLIRPISSQIAAATAEFFPG